MNVRSGRAYRGINIFLLELAGYGDPRWGTYKAIGEAGGAYVTASKAQGIVMGDEHLGPERQSAFNWLSAFYRHLC